MNPIQRVILWAYIRLVRLRSQKLDLFLYVLITLLLFYAVGFFKAYYLRYLGAIR